MPSDRASCVVEAGSRSSTRIRARDRPISSSSAGEAGAAAALHQVPTPRAG